MRADVGSGEPTFNWYRRRKLLLIPNCGWFRFIIVHFEWHLIACPFCTQVNSVTKIENAQKNCIKRMIRRDGNGVAHQFGIERTECIACTAIIFGKVIQFVNAMLTFTTTIIARRG